MLMKAPDAMTASAATPEDDGGMFAPPPPVTLDIAPDHPVARRIAAMSEPRLYLLRRGLNDSD